VCETKRAVTIESVNAAFAEAAKRALKGILEYSDEPLVSSDVLGNPASSVFDSLATMVLGGNMVKVVSWYDNEWGYSNRVVDLMKYAHSKRGTSKRATTGS
jgi:glyceraldehyde 3-phosphate dehydrogenase